MSKITCVHLDGEQAVRSIDRLLSRAKQQHLNDLQSTIVLETWAGSTYRSIADRLSYDIDYIKQTAARLWKSCSRLLGENICKSNFKSALARYQESVQPSNWDDLNEEIKTDLQTIETWMISDRMTIMSISRTGNYQKLESSKIDPQAQSEIESLICQNLYSPVNPIVFVNEVVATLTLNNPENPINCLIINCYLDRYNNYEQIC
jgi:predicted enzyme involved in methoxymalonyl-ACP biosynthesis